MPGAALFNGGVYTGAPKVGGAKFVFGIVLLTPAPTVYGGGGGGVAVTVF
jgi:hypothetical protein